MMDYKWNHLQTRACDDGARAAGQRLTCGAPSSSQVFVFLCICAMSCICCLCICFVLSLAGEAHIKISDNSSIINQTIQRVNMLYYDWQSFSGASWDTSLTGASSPSFLFPLQAQPTHLITDDIRSNVTNKNPKLSPLWFSRPLEDLPYIKVPLHTLIKLTPQAYGCEAEFIRWREASYFLWHFLEMKGFDFKLMAECWRLIALTL